MIEALAAVDGRSVVGELKVAPEQKLANVLVTDHATAQEFLEA